MQTLCVGQGAMFGVLLALGILGDVDSTASLIPFGAALVTSAVTFLFTDRLVLRQMASRNTAFAYTFAFLLACSYLIGSLFPALESHMAQIYFGDLATLTVPESKATLAASVLFCLVLAISWRPFSRQSFESALFGEAIAARKAPQQMVLFKALTLVMLCISVQYLGFLFSISLLFLPTGILSLMKKKGLAPHLVLCAVVSAVSALVGFSLSLWNTRLPTVPTIVVFVTGLSAVMVALDRAVFSLQAIKKGEAIRLSLNQEQKS